MLYIKFVDAYLQCLAMYAYVVIATLSCIVTVTPSIGTP